MWLEIVARAALGGTRAGAGVGAGAETDTGFEGVAWPRRSVGSAWGQSQPCASETQVDGGAARPSVTRLESVSKKWMRRVGCGASPVTPVQ